MIDADIDVIISDIIRSTTELDGVSIPGTNMNITKATIAKY